jgi:hypothetical protein
MLQNNGEMDVGRYELSITASALFSSKYVIERCEDERQDFYGNKQKFCTKT